MEIRQNVGFADFEEVLVYARCLKKEGVAKDGDFAQVSQNDIVKCYHCSAKASPAYAKKSGLVINQTYYCIECRGFVGKCFICQKFFESEKNLSGINYTQVSCKDCSTNK